MIQNAPIREDIQPMPPVWSMWLQALVKAVNGKQDTVTGFTGTVTTASLVGKTITIKNGIITDFS